MSSLAASGTNGAEAFKILSGQRQLEGAAGLDQGQTMTVSDTTDAAPVLDGRGGDADLSGQTFDNLLHTTPFVKSTKMSRGMSLGGSTIVDRPVSWHGFVMKTNLPTRSEMMQGWAKRVRQARLAAGLETQEDLESSLGMSPRTVSTWERGIQMCHPTDMYRLAKLLGVTMDWLVGGDEAFLTLEAKRRLAAITV